VLDDGLNSAFPLFLDHFPITLRNTLSSPTFFKSHSLISSKRDSGQRMSETTHSQFSFSLHGALQTILQTFPDLSTSKANEILNKEVNNPLSLPPTIPLSLTRLLHPLQKWGEKDRDQVIRLICKWILLKENVLPLVLPLIPDIICRLQSVSMLDYLSKQKDLKDTNITARIVCTFSLLLHISPQILVQLLQYFATSPSILDSALNYYSSNKEKDKRLCIELLKALYRFLRFDVKTFSNLWDLTPLFTFIQSKDEEIRTFAMECTCIWIGVSDALLQKLIKNVKIDPESSFILK